MRPSAAISLLILTLFFKYSSGQTIEFVENRGQWESPVLFKGAVPAGAFFVHKDGYTVLQHHPEDWKHLHEISHNHTEDGKPHDPTKPFNLRSHSYRVRFAGARENPRIIADKPLPHKSNFIYGTDPSKWGVDCGTFQGITVKDLYPGIDLRYYTDNNTLKYDLIVHPGADPSVIQLVYEGQDGLDTKRGELQIKTSVGTVRELAPYTYQYDEKGRVPVGARYQIRNNTVRFLIQEYNDKTPLVIDPTWIFSSFSGSTADNWGFTATYGPDGSFYGGGIVFSDGFPLTPGAFQTTFGGGPNTCFGNGFDMGIQKLSPDGTARIYSTYIGGNGNEMPQSLVVDPAGNLVIAGRTNSPNYPVTPNGAPVIGPGGSWDIIITKLNAAGNGLIGSKKIGGKEDDGANINPCGGSQSTSLQQNYGDESRSEVILDAAGNIYLASCTRATTSIIADRFPTLNAFQPNPGTVGTVAAAQDGVVLKMDANVSTLLFSSFIGGTGNDAAYVLAINPANGNVFVAGGTESNNIPGNTGGSLYPTSQGGIDGFIADISSGGGSLNRLTYFGTNSIDQIYGIQFDRAGFPYIMGQTRGNMTKVNAIWGESNRRQFVAKLQPTLGALVYLTTFGKSGSAPDLSPVAFLVDRCENVYVSGWGGEVVQGYESGGVQGLPVTPDAIKSTPDLGSSQLGQDFYFLVIAKNATAQLYGTFFGRNGGSADHVDGGTSRFDENGAIYQAICASCGDQFGFPTTPGSASSTKPPGANCNLAMVKIAFEYAGVASGVQSAINGVPRDTAGCVPLTVDFADTSLTAVSYEWNFGDGPQVFTTNTPNISHTYQNVGTYQVMLVAIDSTTCNIRDTSYITIRVGATEAEPDFTFQRIGNDCNVFSYQFTNTTPEPPGHPFKPTTFTWDFGDNTPRITTGGGPINHTYFNPGTYNVTLLLSDTTYCNSPDSITYPVRVAAIVDAKFTTPATGCAPYAAQFTNTSSGGVQFFWDFGDQQGTSQDPNPTYTYNNPGTYTITLIAVDPNTCNQTDTTQFTITVAGLPTAAFTASPQPPGVNELITFTNNSSADAINFNWNFGDTETLNTTSRNPVQHEYNATGQYQVCLIATNAAGCADTTCNPIDAIIESAVDVPNAFTPLSSDANNIVYVRGFGFAKMRFAIYARWGQKVFETNNKKIGWDGRYNGKQLPMDVYAYTLEVEFTDGTKVRKTGDITLIR